MDPSAESALRLRTRKRLRAPVESGVRLRLTLARSTRDQILHAQQDAQLHGTARERQTAGHASIRRWSEKKRGTKSSACASCKEEAVYCQKSVLMAAANACAALKGCRKSRPKASAPIFAYWHNVLSRRVSCTSWKFLADGRALRP